MIVAVAARYFTPDEANAVLVAVRPVAEELVQARRQLAEAARRRETMRAAVEGNGGDLTPGDFTELTSGLADAGASVTRCLERLEELGVLVKDPDRGLVDFPALRGAEEVLLCWHVGEDDIGYWHGLDEGFAGRKPLPLL